MKRGYRAEMVKGRKKTEEIKRQLLYTERELHRLVNVQWLYAKGMLKFGFASWIFGLSAFFFSIMMMDVKLFWMAPPISISLLIGALAAPVVVTVLLIRKFAVRIKRLERIRVGLLVEYEKVALRRVEELVTSKR